MEIGMVTLFGQVIVRFVLLKHFLTATTSGAATPSATDVPLQEFLAATEQLIMQSTDRALNVTKNVYKDWQSQMTPDLCHLACPLILAYVDEVNRVQLHNASYAEKRKLFARFRMTNSKIEMLQDQLLLQPQAERHRFQYSLISEEFYSQGRNSTEFDNLYLDFMQLFEAASRSFWSSMTETTVEQQEELLEILDEISNEPELREKDKLYDEFIEMYLFKKST